MSFLLAWLLLAPQPRTLTVAADGTAPYRTVQAAVDAVPENNTEPILILLRPGIYKERLVVAKNKPKITLRGEDATKTVLTFDRSARTLNPEGKPYGTSESASTLIQADDFTAENITFANSAGRGKEVGQAVAIRISGDRELFRKCRFTGWQDTLYATGTGRQVFQDCYIEGDVDFIFGHAAARFERCQIHSKGQGYITAQARDTADVPGGYLFQDCTLTAAGDVKPGTVYLGRPWRDYARVAFVRCTLGAHIRPEGWHNWDKPEREKTAHFAEVDCTGPGAAPEKRVPWAKKTAF